MTNYPRIKETTREPPPGSIIMLNGPGGTAVQRLHSDRMWHSTTGQVMTWKDITHRASKPLNHPNDIVFYRHKGVQTR